MTDTISLQSSGVLQLLEAMILCGALVIHFLSDFIFYPYKMICSTVSSEKEENQFVFKMSGAERRKEDQNRMTKHVLSFGAIFTSYWLVLSVVLVDLLSYPPEKLKQVLGLTFFVSIVNMFSHGIIDITISGARAKALIRQDCEKFWWLMTLDQILHISILIITGQYFVHKLFYSIL